MFLVKHIPKEYILKVVEILKDSFEELEKTIISKS
jgi:hypothetical protein